MSAPKRRAMMDRFVLKRAEVIRISQDFRLITFFTLGSFQDAQTLVEHAEIYAVSNVPR